MLNKFTIRYSFLALILLLLSVHQTKAQQYVKDILNEKIPVPYQGKLLQAYEYKDNAGLHLLLLSKVKASLGDKVTIYGTCYTQTNGAFAKDWSITDFSATNVLIYYTHTKIVDIDNDGIYETLFVYQLNAYEQAGEWKVMLHYKNQKYAVRVHIPGYATEQLGWDKSTVVMDKTFDTIPPSVKKYVADYWNDVADRNDLSAVLP